MSSLITSPAYFDLLFHQRKKINVPHEETDILGNASLLLLTFVSSTGHAF